MAVTTAPVTSAAEILVTHQEYKGPNVTLWNAKNIKYMDQVEANGKAGDKFSAEKHTMLNIVGFVDLTATDDVLGAGTNYVDSIFNKAAIGSEYKCLICGETDGVVAGVKKFVKIAKAGAVADWAVMIAVPGVGADNQIIKMNGTALNWEADA